MVEDKDFDFSEESDWSPETRFSIKEIVHRHIKKISDICCQEFTGGYWEKKPIKTTSGVLFTEEYHPDVREAYCNAVDFLVDVLYPLGDDKLKKHIDEHDIDIKDIKEKLKDRRKMFKEINKMFDNNNFWEQTGVSNE